MGFPHHTFSIINHLFSLSQLIVFPSNKQLMFLLSMTFPLNSNQSIYIYIYIYISRNLMQESMRSCHVAYFMKRIEILLSHIRDKNKFKNMDLLFLLVQCFKTNFCFLLINISRLLFVSFGSIVQDFSSLSHTHTKNSLHFHNPSFHSISNTLQPKMMLFAFDL